MTSEPLRRRVPCRDMLGRSTEIDVQLHGRVTLLKTTGPVELTDDAAILLAATVLTMISTARTSTQLGEDQTRTVDAEKKGSPVYWVDSDGVKHVPIPTTTLDQAIEALGPDAKGSQREKARQALLDLAPRRSHGGS